jgi:hypothetical protein
MIYQVIIYLVVAVALVGGSFYTGVRVANNACDAAQLKRVQEAEKARMVDEWRLPVKHSGLSIAAPFLILVSSCSTMPLTTRTPAPANLTQLCQPLPLTNAKEMGELLTYTIELANLYGECANRQKYLSNWAIRNVP